MGNRYTPGKWERIGRLVYAINDKGTNRFTARFESAGQPEEADAEECEANATLAVTAPDLLDALEKLLDEQNGPPLLSREAAWNAAVTAARAALAKARGIR